MPTSMRSFARTASGYWPSLLAVALSLLIINSARGDGSDLIVDYLERYHKLSEKDIDGRMNLADWCKRNELHQQRADLLTEVLKLHPGHPVAYRELMDADQKRTRPVDKQWAEKLEGLLGNRYKLYHSAHFTVLSDCDEQSAQMQAEAMEDTYLLYYRNAAAIGLRPMPPANRLVCVLFERFDDYTDFLRKFEGAQNAWSAGYYSWRSNRTSFFHDRDNPVFKDVREKITSLEEKIKELHGEMENLGAGQTAKRLTIQDQLKHNSAQLADINARLNYAGRISTLSKTRHEATHQLLFNSGVQRRGKDYPFWLGEGLAMLFESVDGEGRAGPGLVNGHRLRTYRGLQANNELIPLADLMRERPKDNDSAEQVSGRYAQAWALTHYLWNKQPARMAAYLKAMDQIENPDWGKLFATYFGEDFNALEAAVKGHVEGM
jgi:hypothetical protein